VSEAYDRVIVVGDEGETGSILSREPFVPDYPALRNNIPIEVFIP
jgi:hypothetical protein